MYVRQSTPGQVRGHVESQRRQYALADVARDMGFRRVETIDDDLGISGSGFAERPGFQRLLTTVGSGAAGAVLALEALRLARNDRDWSQLVELGAITKVVLIDHDGICDPRLVNDRLLLGLKGIMSGPSDSGPTLSGHAAPSQPRRCRRALWAQLSYRAKRLWPAVFLHSFHNGVSQWLFPKVFAGGDETWLGEGGVLPLSCYVVAAIGLSIVVRRQGGR